MPDFEEKVKAAFEAEFERARPRPGLRGRVIANAVATPRTRQRGFGAWLTPPRLALVGAAAAVLVVAGVGLRVATQSAPPTAVKPTPSPSSLLAFGKLPAPSLHPLRGLGGLGGGNQTITPYFGPATMSWSGQLPKVPSSVPVYRFTLPTAADADAFAARLGAKLVSAGSAGDPRRYTRSDGSQLLVQLADPVAGEATWILNRPIGPNPTRPFTDEAARAAADAELARLGLTPSWQATVQVVRLQTFGGNDPQIVIVQYQRVIPLPDGTSAPEVDGNADPSGIKVIMDTSARIMSVSGILRLAEQPATYPLSLPSTAVNAAVSAAPLITPKDSGPVPTVALTQATLVYTTVASGAVGYLEPAYLFTGTFKRDIYTYEKRVLVPALAPNAIGSP
jgi:hypothetical protein